MEQTKALAVVNRPQLTPQVWQMISEVAPTMHLARIFGVASKEQAAAVMLKGYELGLSLSGSFEFIQVVEGKPSLSPRGALALIQSSPLYGGMKITEDADKCTVWMKRADNGFEHTVTWSLDDAKRAGVVKPGSGWEKYPTNMIRWRAIGFCADVVFPDVIGGMKRADEYGADITPGGDVIEGTWTVTTPAANGAAPTIEVAKPSITLDGLLAQHGAEAIMAANSGRIPGTDEELQAVAAALGASNA